MINFWNQLNSLTQNWPAFSQYSRIVGLTIIKMIKCTIHLQQMTSFIKNKCSIISKPFACLKKKTPCELALNHTEVVCHQYIMHALVRMLMTRETRRVCWAIQWHQVNCHPSYMISYSSHPSIYGTGINYPDIKY